MIRETWCWWIILLLFIGQTIQIFLHANGYKKNISWDADLSDRLTSIILSLVFMFIYAIALGWILK